MFEVGIGRSHPSLSIIFQVGSLVIQCVGVGVEFSLIIPIVVYLTKTVCRNLTLVFVVCFLHVHA